MPRHDRGRLSPDRVVEQQKRDKAREQAQAALWAPIASLTESGGWESYVKLIRAKIETLRGELEAGSVGDDRIRGMLAAYKDVLRIPGEARKRMTR